MEHETFVSLETAKLLKKAGFDWECNHYYFTQNGKTESKSDFRYPARNYNETMATMDSKSFEFEVCSRPTLDVARRWLREVKDYHIIVEYDGYQRVYQCRLDSYVHMYDLAHREWIDDYRDFSTYEEALETGILKCLTLLLENNE